MAVVVMVDILAAFWAEMLRCCLCEVDLEVDLEEYLEEDLEEVDLAESVEWVDSVIDEWEQAT
jgi:hypothetical protein